MRRRGFFVLICIIIWIGMLVRTFFWWNPNNNEELILQDITTWFVQELTNTWTDIENIQMNTWNIQTYTWDIQTKNDTIVRIMMPKYFYNSEWDKFKQDLYNDKKILINFILIDDLNSYREQLFDKYFWWADMFLFPYDWNDKVSKLIFSPQDDISSMFDELVSPIIKEHKIWFLPFSADPMIMYAVSWYSSPNTFYNISEYISNRESIAPLSFPLFFGIAIEDYNNKWFEWEYQDIVRYALIHYFKTNNDNYNLELRVENNVLENYNIQNLNTILNAIPAAECKYFPSICFQVYNFVWIRFWFLSDADVVNQYFNWKKSKFENLSRLSTPFSQIESPVRIRWRWISDKISDIEISKWINEILTKYMNEHNKYGLRNSTLPVFKSAEWLDNNRYIWMRWYILQSWWDYINTLRWISSFRDLIEYKITAKEFLK